MAAIIGYGMDSVKEVGDRLKAGEVGIFPCDTIYGLCGIATEETADRLYEIKRRPQSKSFITLMTMDDVRRSQLSVPDDILSRWPAPLTAILASPDGTTAAVRVPADPFVQAVMAICGPVFSTSVNFSGEKSLLTFQDILPVFESSVDFIMNAPEVKGGMASTLVDATHYPYKVLRQGAYVL